MTLKRVFAILFSAMMLTQPVLTQAAITNVTDDSGGGGTVDATSDVNRENWSTTDENRKNSRLHKKKKNFCGKRQGTVRQKMER